mgnify:CR=1 FL=1
MTIAVKICGLRDAHAVAAAVDGGAAMVGFVFFPPSPRNITPEQASALTKDVPEGVTRVGLCVDADDETLADIVATAGIDMLQLHGSETPERVKDIRERFGLPVMKALLVATPEDVKTTAEYEAVADRLLFDAKPPKEATRPGGNAEAFDWSLVKDNSCNKPWLLAGGLTAENLAEAVKTSGAEAVDVSSGVEDAPGIKSVEKIAAFLAAAKGL